MSAIQCRDRKDVHESKDNGEEGSHVPELMPVPRCGEDASDSTETAQLLRSFFREEVFHVADVSFQCLHTQRNTCGEGFKKCVLLLHHRQQAICCHTSSDTHQVSRVHTQGGRIRHAATYIRQGDQTGVDAVFQQGFRVFLAFRHRLLEIRERNGGSVQCDDTVTRLNARLCSRRINHHAVNHIRETERSKTNAVRHQSLHHIFGNVDRSLFTFTKHTYFTGIGNLAQHIAVIAHKRHIIGRQKDVAILKTDCFRRLIEVHTERSFLYLYILVAPSKKNH